MTEDEMVGWHHQLNGQESEKTPGDGEGQGSVACCHSWDRKESNSTEELNNTKRVGYTIENITGDKFFKVIKIFKLHLFEIHFHWSIFAL